MLTNRPLSIRKTVCLITCFLLLFTASGCAIRFGRGATKAPQTPMAASDKSIVFKWAENLKAALYNRASFNRSGLLVASLIAAAGGAAIAVLSGIEDKPSGDTLLMLTTSTGFVAAAGGVYFNDPDVAKLYEDSAKAITARLVGP